jgi:hypothetical protein
VNAEAVPRELLAAMKPRLIDAARSVAKDAFPGSHVGETQFRNLAQLCQEADVPEEIQAFVDYQGARSGGWPSILVQAVQRELATISAEAEKAAAGSPRAVLDLFAFFFGYLAWAVKGLGRSGSSSGSRAPGHAGTAAGGGQGRGRR